MKSNLKIYAIQNDVNELDFALNKLDKGINYIYSNCTFDFKIGWTKIKSKKFDTFLYNEESDVLIMLMRGGKVNKEKIIEYLEKNNKPYSEINFYPLYDTFEGKDNIPEIRFVREKKDLALEIKESIEKGITSCDFYPLLESYFMLGYKTIDGEKIEIDGRKFIGLINLSDKIILLVNQKYNVDEKGVKRNIDIKDVLYTLKKYNVTPKVILDDIPNIEVENFSKKLTLNDKTY